MAKQADKKKDLMIQKINLTDSILLYWEKQLRQNLTAECNKFLFNLSDIHQKFEVDLGLEKRYFSLEGMTPEDYTILKEYKETGDIYWMCKYEYTQFLMNKFNVLTKIKEFVDKKTKTKSIHVDEVQKEYTDSQLYLPNKSARRRASEPAIEKVEKIKDPDSLFEDEDEDVEIIPLDEVEAPEDYAYLNEINED